MFTWLLLSFQASDISHVSHRHFSSDAAHAPTFGSSHVYVISSSPPSPLYRHRLVSLPKEPAGISSFSLSPFFAGAYDIIADADAHIISIEYFSHYDDIISRHFRRCIFHHTSRVAFWLVECGNRRERRQCLPCNVITYSHGVRSSIRIINKNGVHIGAYLPNIPPRSATQCRLLLPVTVMCVPLRHWHLHVPVQYLQPRQASHYIHCIPHMPINNTIR